MRKRNGALLTLALAGTMALCGVGGLHVSMANAMQEEMTTQIEQKEATILDESTQETAKNQVWQEEESIYLPEGAEIVAKNETGYDIVWDDCSIRYWQGEPHAKETKEDLGLAKLKSILKNTIKQYSGQDMGKCELDVALVEPLTDGIGNVDASVFAPDNGTQYVEDAEGVTQYVGDAEGVKVYDIDTKCYQVHVTGISQHKYIILVDSVTGEVTAFLHEDLSLGSFSQGWEMEKEKEYESIIESFVSDDLKLGNVQKIYGIRNGIRFDIDSSIQRTFYEALCKTDNGTVVEVTIDCGTKTVKGFCIDVVYLTGEE